ncbi:MAG: GNAT family N-acetyltransferase [Pseudomonadota bacterium]
METTTSLFTHRLATHRDIPALSALMDAAIRQLLPAYLPPEAVAASFAVMGLDSQLIEDRTYFVIEHERSIVGCGGWSRRATLYGGDGAQGRDAALLDPERDAARIRAMYTHPDWTRRGIGRLILRLCEAAAGKAGFKRCALAATLAGAPLYRACGYVEVARLHSPTPSGVAVPLIHMEKSL